MRISIYLSSKPLSARNVTSLKVLYEKISVFALAQNYFNGKYKTQLFRKKFGNFVRKFVKNTIRQNILIITVINDMKQCNIFVIENVFSV